MLLFETILFYNGVPSYYNVYRQDNKYSLEANTPAYYKNTPFPNFSLTEANGSWIADGTNDQSLIEQIVKDIEKYGVSKMALV